MDAGSGVREIAMAELPEGWAAKTSSSTGRTYYLNEYTKATQWEKPEPVPPGQVRLLASSPGPFKRPGDDIRQIQDPFLSLV